MRLIDADLLTEKITKWLKYDPDADNRMVNIDDIAVSVLMEIEEQPTAFDVDKIIEQMKNGAKVKLPGWNGYWCWDIDKQTIMIHCRPKDSDKGQGEVLDIRETQRVEYTFMHTQRDDWMIADEENCGVLGGQSTFGFGDAIRYLKRGLKVARKGWNGKNQYIQLATGISYKTADNKIVNCEHNAIGNMAVAFVGTSGVQMGWLASQADMLAEDWVFAKQED